MISPGDVYATLSGNHMDSNRMAAYAADMPHTWVDEDTTPEHRSDMVHNQRTQGQPDPFGRHMVPRQ